LKIYKMTYKFFHDILEQFGTIIIAPILFGAILGLLNYWSERVKKRTRFYHLQFSAEKNEKIQYALTEIRMILNCGRAYLGMFHDGSKYVDGSEVLKISRTNESVKDGVSFESQYYQNIPISLLVDEMKLVEQEGPAFTKTSDLKDGKFRRMLMGKNIKAVARCSIRRNNEIVGYLGVDFVENADPPINIDELCRYANTIEQILSNYY